MICLIPTLDKYISIEKLNSKTNILKKKTENKYIGFYVIIIVDFCFKIGKMQFQTILLLRRIGDF